ncbi:MAG: DUF6070 family protein, partial [bacterium]
MRKSVYITICLLGILCAAGCADKDGRGTPVHEALTETTAVPGLTENAPEPSGESSEEPENPFISHFTDLLSEKEKEQLRNGALSAAESVRELCEEYTTADAVQDSSGVSELTSAQCMAAAEQLGKAGLVSVAEDTDMQNPEKIEAFYTDYLNGQDSMVTVFDVQRDGRIGAVTFVFRNEQLQSCYIGIEWKEDGTPEIENISINNVAEIKLTEKGYFIYAYDTVNAHGCLRQYWRISPLSEKCRQLTKKYISGLSYLDLNILVTDWDSSNVGDILEPCLYDAVYHIYTGRILPSDTERIPAGEYEKIMTTYLPATVEQLREFCGYDEDSDSYEFEKMHVTQYPPFGEVVDFAENADGTITLIVDGVWPDRNTDLAFRNTLVVQPFGDGTFRYLSNS